MTDSGSSRTTATRRGRARARLDALVPARLRHRQSRGAAELSVLVVTGSLIGVQSSIQGCRSANARAYAATPAAKSSASRSV